MGVRARILAAFGAALGIVLVGLGIVYLVVACEDLPGFMGPHPGDTAPRTGLGVVGLVLGVASLAIAAFVFERRSAGG